ncbi:MAG TPA: hypothetical protein VGG33_00725 [Polyangia bacterium]
MQQAVASARENDTELLLAIGGVVGHVVLERPPARFAAEIADRFGAFCLPNSPQVERAFSIRLRCDDVASERAPRATAGEAGLRVDASGTNIVIERGDFAARLARPLPSAGPHQGVGRTNASLWSFESLLRVLWSICLPRAGGALIHGCGLQTAGRGILAPGASGVGKTTLASKAGNEAFADEIVALHRGSDQQWRVSATPFFGEQAFGEPSMRSHPLAAIAFLEQRPSLEVEHLPLPAAVGRLLGCFISFETGTGAVERNLAIAVDLCQRVAHVACGSSKETPWAEMRAALTPHLPAAIAPGSAPDNVRELVAALRSNLRRHGRYAFAPRGTSMRPFVRSGDMVFVESVTDAAVRAGDVLLYWRAGATPELDTLTCHRMIGRIQGETGPVILAKGDSLPHIEALHTTGPQANGGRAELLGRVRAISRPGRQQSWAVPGRIGSLGIVMASLLASGLFPLTRLVPRK